jgi:hypothetical protein
VTASDHGAETDVRDRNPRLECDGCGKSNGWQDGAKDWRGAQDPEADTLLCDDCGDEVPRNIDKTPVEHRRDRNASIAAFSPSTESDDA